ncbi:MAG TPA: hypothetical protein VIT45_03110 [Allosphingosinicella sp.]
MSEIHEEQDPQLWKRAAEAELAAASHSRNTLIEAHQDAYKWLLASLLAINGTGMLAIVNSSALSITAKIVAAVFFYAGIIASLLSSYLSQRASRALIVPFSELMAYWITVAHDGVHVPEMLNEIDLKVQRAVRKARPVEFAGWASVVCFSAGLATAAFTLASPPDRPAVTSARSPASSGELR